VAGAIPTTGLGVVHGQEGGLATPKRPKKKKSFGLLGVAGPPPRTKATPHGQYGGGPKLFFFFFGLLVVAGPPPPPPWGWSGHPKPVVGSHPDFCTSSFLNIFPFCFNIYIVLMLKAVSFWV
jgi:hypothetical protein